MIEIDNSLKSNGFSGVTSFNFSYTTSGDKGFLEVSVYTGNQNTSNMTVSYGGQAMTLLETCKYNTLNIYVRTFILVNPPSGANTVQVNWTGSSYGSCYAKSYNGVDQTSPIGAHTFSNASSPTTPRYVSLNPTIADSWIVCACVGANQLLAWMSGYGSNDSNIDGNSDNLFHGDSGGVVATGAQNAGFATSSGGLSGVIGYVLQPDVAPAVTYDVTTETADTIEQTTANLNGSYTVDPDDIYNYSIDWGFDWGTESVPTLEDNDPAYAGYEEGWSEGDGIGPGSTNHGITGLTAGTTYYYRFYIKTPEDVWEWGEELSFTTDEAPSYTVTTNAGTVTGPRSATLNGEYSKVNAGDVTEWGFVYATASQINPGDVAPNASGYNNFTQETGTLAVGAFVDDVVSLAPETTYYIRAYILGDLGYEYGDEVTIVTDVVNYGISGVVTKSGTPVTGAVVRAINMTTGEALTPAETTDANGAYTFENLDYAVTYHMCVEYTDDNGNYNTYSYWGIQPYAID